MNKAGGGTNVPKMAKNIQMAAGGGMVGSTLDPTKTAASMPHVFEAAKRARAEARALGLPPKEVERRVIQASERAKASGPTRSGISISGAFGSTHSMDGPPTPDNSNYSVGSTPTSSPPTKNYKVSGPIVSDKSAPTESSSSSGGGGTPPTTGGSVKMPPSTVMGPSTPFKSERLNKALTGIKPGAWKSGKKTPSLSPIKYSSAVKTSTPKIDVSIKTTPSNAMTPVKTPVGNRKPNIINLPTKTSAMTGPPVAGAANPDIPKFSSVRQTSKRNTTLLALGINDLVGVTLNGSHRS